MTRAARKDPADGSAGGRPLTPGETREAGDAGHRVGAANDGRRHVTNAAVSERVIDVHGTPVRYRVAGTGEPIVLVHGLGGSTRWWTPSLAALAESHRVHLIDLPGFGAMRGRGRFVFADAASWLGAWIDAMELRPVDVVGHSLGAAVSLRLAATRPEAVRRLVLVAPAGLRTRRLMLAHLPPLLRTVAQAPPRFLVVLAHDALRAGPRTVWRATRQLLDEDVREDLRRVRSPTLLVFGERDRLVPPALGHVFRRELAASRLLVLERAGHVPMFDRPGAFEAAVVTFLAGEPIGD